MESIFGFAEFVKEQAGFHERKALEFQENKRAWFHKKTAQQFRSLERSIEDLRNNTTIIRRSTGFNPYAVAPGDITGLPDELLSQLLNKPENDRLESEIVDIINNAGGTLLIDHIIIGLYKRTGTVHDRTQLVSKIHRMNKKRLIHSVSGRKGVYTTIPPSNASQADADVEEPPS